MPTVLQFRRGTTTQNNAFTGNAGELSVDTTLDTVRIHDGSTAGGFTLTQNAATQTLTNKTLTSPVLTTPTVATSITINAAGEVRFGDDNTSNYVGFKSPGTVSSNVIWTLPSADGTSGQALVSNGSGVLSFADAGALGANSIDSDNYVDGSIDAEHFSLAGLQAPHQLDATPAADHTATGPQTNTFNAGYGNAVMDLVYLGGSSTWLEADSDAVGTSINLLGIALAAVDSGAALNVALAGSFVRDDTFNFTPGVPLYVSGTLGAITATKPTGSGDIVRTVGYAVTADVIYFNPSSDYVVLA